MIKNIIRTKKDIITLVVGKVLQVVLALLSLKILTSILSENEIGQYYLLITILTLFNFSFLNPIGQYYGRHVIGWSQTGKLKLATDLLISIRLAGISCSIAVACIIYEVFEYDKYYQLWEFVLFIFVSLLSGTYLVLLNNLNTLGKRVLFIKYLIASLSIGLIFSVLIAKFDGRGIGWLFGIALAEMLCLYPVYKQFSTINPTCENRLSWAELKAQLTKNRCEKILYFIAPITVTLFLQWGQNLSYRIIIENKYSIEILAIIAVGFSVSGAIFNAVSSLALQYFTPIYLKRITGVTKQERAIAWNDYASALLPIYVCLLAFVICLTPYLLNILVASKFHDVFIFVILGAVIEFFKASSNIVYMVSQSEINTKTTIFPYVIGFTFSVLILYFVDFTENLWFIAVVLSCSYCTIFSFLYYNMKKILPVKIKMSSLSKSVLLSIPFFGIPLVDLTPSGLLSLLLVFTFGMYFILCVYLLNIVELKREST